MRRAYSSASAERMRAVRLGVKSLGLAGECRPDGLDQPSEHGRAARLDALAKDLGGALGGISTSLQVIGCERTTCR